MIAGVAAGIGRRYGIDPVVVRVVLVVSAFYGGAGLLIYLLGWLFLPADTDKVSAFESMIGRGRSATSTGLTVVLCLALIGASSFVIGGRITQLVGAVMLLAALYLLHRSRSDHGRPPTPPASSDPTEDPTMSMPTGFGSPAHPEDQPPAGPTEPAGPPAWDPLGAAPFAWDLPDPNPTPPPPPPLPMVPRRRSRVGLVTTGATLVTIAALVLFAPVSHGWLTPLHGLGIVTSVLGVGLVAAAFARRGRWLIAPAVLLSIIGVSLTATGITSWHGTGDTTFTPTTLAQVAPDYDRSLGDLTLDLTQLPTTAGSKDISLHLGAGDLRIYVPDNAAVTATCHSSAGDINCLDQQASGLNQSETGSSGNLGDPNVLKIHIDANVGTGDVVVSRG
jgi:phage shock protein PspC (stress-responsive transcriptional regulator)